MKIEYPKSSGEFIEFPEMDRYEFFSASMAKNKINPTQIHLIDKLEQIIFADFNHQRIVEQTRRKKWRPVLYQGSFGMGWVINFLVLSVPLSLWWVWSVSQFDE